jgi:DMSO/TMAO reductase YedYZ molybdopterin-dependent catalytic subunit
MTTRRDIIKYFSRLFLWGATTIGIGLSSGSNLFAKIKKRIIPKNTDPHSLRNANPEFLDTRNLQVMPLEAFGTMGDKDAPFNSETWRLKVIGAIRTPLELTYDEILAMPPIERTVLLVCPGVFTNHGKWKGISFKGLMKKADPLMNASKVVVYGHSRFGDRKEYFTIEDVKIEKMFLAYEVNGRKLPRKHGFPLRVVAEGHWGSEWVKYVNKIEFI